MHYPFKSPVFWSGMVITLLAGIGLLLLSAWMRPLTLGETAAREGRWSDALGYYTAAGSRLEDRGWLRGLFPGAYEASQVNQYRILYRLGEFDRLQEMGSPGPGAEAHFWAGAALYRLAMNETEVPARLAWLRRAGEEFHNALELAPADWDHKFNYELTMRLIAELSDEEEPPPQVLELLRPKPREGNPPSPPAG